MYVLPMETKYDIEAFPPISLLIRDRIGFLLGVHLGAKFMQSNFNGRSQFVID